MVQLAKLLSADERVRCTIVFDAIEAPSGLDRHFRHAEIQIHFAEPGHDADSLIEALIDSHSSPSHLLVVSSDHRLQKAAKQRRAESVDSEAFLQQLLDRAKAAAAAAEKAASQSSKPVLPKVSRPGQEDVQFWLGEFGEIDVDAIARSDDPETTTVDPFQKRIQDLQKELDDASNLDDWLNQPPGKP